MTDDEFHALIINSTLRLLVIYLIAVAIWRA